MSWYRQPWRNDRANDDTEGACEGDVQANRFGTSTEE